MRKVFAFILSYILTSTPVRVQNIELLGAGATFPYPLYSKMFDVYYREYGVKINYQAIGSGGGIRQLINKTVDFGASDAFLSENELKKLKNPILHIPICLGAVAITYNLPQNPEIKFTPDIIADIFLGKIKKWNNERLRKINPEIKLPDMDIIVVHRSDGSGTTFIFTDYLSRVSNEWNKRIGKGKSVRWPIGLGAKGNTGVAGLIKQIPGSIGYVELVYAIQNKMPVGIIKNKKGNFVKPSIESVMYSGDVKLPDDTRTSIVDTEHPRGYPISGFTWIIVYREQNYNSRDERRARELVKLLWWMTHEGQKYMKPLHYAPLPQSALKKAERIIKSITYKGRPVWKE
jgi:phosphate transport system substrate-binding protein